MQDITELERRITAAMERITKGVDALSDAGSGAASGGEIARLTEALDEERMANAQLSERLRVLHEKVVASEVAAPVAAPAAVSAELTAQLAAQADELTTLRQILAKAGDEIADLRAARAAEAAEAAEIATALEPLIAEANHA